MIQRPALGQPVSLGDLYNIHTDRLCGLSMLRTPPTNYNDLTTSISCCTETSCFPDLSSLQLKLTQNLVTCPQHQLSILSGLSPLESSSNFLKNEKLRSNIVRATLLGSVTTKFDTLNILQAIQCGRTINVDRLKVLSQTGATHVVFQIRYGGILKVTAESILKEKSTDNYKETTTRLLEYLTSLTVYPTNTQLEEKLNRNDNIRLSLQGDTISNENVSWQVTRGRLSTIVPQTSGSEGVPIVFYLVPLAQIIPELTDVQLNGSEMIQVKFLELEFLPIFDSILKVKQKLNDLLAEGENKYLFKNMPLLKGVEDIEELKRNFEMEEMKFKMEIVNWLPKARSNTENGREHLQMTLNNYKENFYYPKNLEGIIKILPYFDQTSCPPCPGQSKNVQDQQRDEKETMMMMMKKYLDEMMIHDEDVEDVVANGSNFDDVEIVKNEDGESMGNSSYSSLNEVPDPATTYDSSRYRKEEHKKGSDVL